MDIRKIYKEHNKNLRYAERLNKKKVPKTAHYYPDMDESWKKFYAAANGNRLKS